MPFTRRWGIFPIIVLVFNVILVIAVTVILVRTESSLHECMKHVPPLPRAHPPGLAECQSSSEYGSVGGILLGAAGILVDLVFLAVWLWVRHVRHGSTTVAS